MPNSDPGALKLGPLLSKKDRDNYRWAMRDVGTSEGAYIKWLGRYEATVQDLETKLDACRVFISNLTNEAGCVFADTEPPE